jgi:hypothetical protein
MLEGAADRFNGHYVSGYYDTWNYLPVACFLTFISRS